MRRRTGGLRLSIALLGFAVSVAMSQTGDAEWLMQASGLEIELSPGGVEALRYRGRAVLGSDTHHRGDVMAPAILKVGWGRLAETAETEVHAHTDTTGAGVAVWDGQMNEIDGAGRWSWHQELRLSAEGRLTITYRWKQLTPPDQAILTHRYVFAMVREEVLVPTPGDKVTPRTRVAAPCRRA